MPLALNPAEKIKRAAMLIAECRAMPEPPRGQARGRWVVKMRSRLGRATRLIEPKRFRLHDDFSDTERAQASALLAEVDRLYPHVNS